MAPPHLQQSNRAFGPSPVRFGKHVRIEEVPDEEGPSGRSNNVTGSRVQHQDEIRHTHPIGEDRRAHGQQSKQQENPHGQSTKQHHSSENQEKEQQSQADTQAEAEPETHELFNASGVGATPQNPSVFLHTSSNPAMALGYSQSYSFLPNQVIATQAGAQAATNTLTPITQPVIGNTYQASVQDPNVAESFPQSTTYVGPPAMASYRNMDFQTGAPNHPQGLHFQPPVPDTTYGPMTHVYVPRHDGVAPPVVPGGPVQVPVQPQVAVSTNPTLTVHHQVPAPTIQPHVAAQPGVFVSNHGMPGTFPVQPAQNPVMYAGSPGMVPGVPGVPGSVTAHLPPDVTGIGKTIAEIQAYHQDIAMTNNVLEPEDFQPASKDPARMYYCRELDGNWTLRSRYSIDKMGEWRWYQTPDGIFYAVRLPN